MGRIRFRLTAWRLMVAVVVVAFVLGTFGQALRLQARYSAIAEAHRSFCNADLAGLSSEQQRNAINRIDWHTQLAEKYDFLALRPWLPNFPDPPPPE